MVVPTAFDRLYNREVGRLISASTSFVVELYASELLSLSEPIKSRRKDVYRQSPDDEQTFDINDLIER